MSLLTGGLILCLTLLTGCASPSKANIALRKKNQSLESDLAKLKTDLAADRAKIAGLETRVGTVPTLPESKLDQMYTVHSVKLGRLTGGANFDSSKPGDQGIRIDLIPLDDDGDPVKATGRASVEAVDLTADPPQLIGRWHFSAAQMKQTWRSLGPIHEFVLECPWKGVVPAHPQITLKVDFTDELTGRAFSLVQHVKVQLPPATQPTSRP